MRMDIHTRGKIYIRLRLAKIGNSLKLSSLHFFNKMPDSAELVNFKILKKTL